MPEPIDPAVRQQMNDIAAILEAVFKQQGNYGFALLVFDFDKIEGGHMNWISNARREEMVSALREQAAYLEGATHQAPPARQ